MKMLYAKREELEKCLQCGVLYRRITSADDGRTCIPADFFYLPDQAETMTWCVIQKVEHSLDLREYGEVAPGIWHKRSIIVEYFRPDTVDWVLKVGACNEQLAVTF